MKRMKRWMTWILTAVLLAGVLPADPAGVSAADSGATERANVVLFAHFKGDGQGQYFNKTRTAQIEKFYNGSYGRSLKSYLSTVSNGKYQVHNYFPQKQADGTIKPYELSIEQSAAATKNCDYTIITELLEKAGIPSAGGTIDYDGDGAVDNLTVILVGSSSSASAGLPTLWPHQSFYTGSKTLEGKQVSSFNMLNTQRLFQDESGLIIHEYLHTLGYPDLYRQSNEDYCVYTWDIMGQSSKYVSWPLAYLRQAISGWTSLPVIDKSMNNVTIANPNEAVVIQAPGNPNEVFVVECRKKGQSTDENSLDAGIGNSQMSAGTAGLIVYRIDKTATGLSNSFGKTGVYVFRGGAEKSKDAVQGAYWTAGTVGTGDKTQGITDSALTYTDGTNSRVVIENITSHGTDGFTFNVAMPASSDYDLWEDTNFPTVSEAELLQVDGTSYAVGLSDSQVTMYSYGDNGWSRMGNPTSVANINGGSMRLIAHNGVLRLFYLEREATGARYAKTLKSKVFDTSTNTWDEGPQMTVPAGNEFNGYDVAVMGETLYVNCLYDDYKKASLVKLDGNQFDEISSYLTEGNTEFYGEPVLTTDGRALYLGLRKVSGDGICLWKSDGNAPTALTSPGASSTYALQYYNGSLYCALSESGQNLKVRTFADAGGNWTDYAVSDMDSSKVNLTISQGNLYAVTKPAKADSDKKLRVYAVANGQLKQEGEPVAILENTGNYSLISSGENLFVSYIDEKNQAVISKKTTANRLLSLTVTPPTKISYVQGEAVQTDGLRVVANYVEGSVELQPGQYTVSGFETETVGEKGAAVTFAGVESSFRYWVLPPQTDSTEEDPGMDPEKNPNPPSSDPGQGTEPAGPDNAPNKEQNVGQNTGSNTTAGDGTVQAGGTSSATKKTVKAKAANTGDENRSLAVYVVFAGTALAVIGTALSIRRKEKPVKRRGA